MPAKKPTPTEMKDTVAVMLELDIINTPEMVTLAQWMLEEYRTSVAKKVVAAEDKKLKAEGKKFKYPALAVKSVRKFVDITWNDELFDATARASGLVLKGADAD